MGRFPEVCRIRGLKVKAGTSKIIVLNGEEGLGVSYCRWGAIGACVKIKYLGYVLDE